MTMTIDFALLQQHEAIARQAHRQRKLSRAAISNNRNYSKGNNRNTNVVEVDQN